MIGFLESIKLGFGIAIGFGLATFAGVLCLVVFGLFLLWFVR